MKKLWLAAVVMTASLVWVAVATLGGSKERALVDHADTDTRKREPHRSGAEGRTSVLVVSGTVRNTSGDSIAGAHVVPLPESSDSARSSDDGHWSLRLRLPPTRLVATAQGYAPRLVEVDEESYDNVSIVLERYPHALRGVVRDATGGEISDAKVAISLAHHVPSWPRSYTVRTDENGRYELPLPPVEGVVAASHPDYVAKTTRLAGPTTEHRWDVALIPASVVAGTTVAAATGEPVGGVVVSTGEATVLSDAHGKYELRGLPPGRLQLSAYASGFSSQFDIVLELGLGEQLADVDIHLATATDISGKVVYASDETPIEDASVAMVSRRGPSRTALSDRNGVFTLIGVPQGAHSALVAVEGCVEQIVSVADEALEIVVRVDCGFWVRGRVVPPVRARVSGRPPETAPTGLLIGSPVTLERVSSSDDDGRFVIGPFDVDHVVVEARSENGSKGRAETTRDYGGELEIRLEERYRMQGRLVDTDGEGVANAEVEATMLGGNGDENDAVDLRTAEVTTTGPDGDFEIRGLEGGAYKLSVFDSRRQHLGVIHPENGKFVVADQDLEGLRLEVDGNSASISGRVSSADEDVTDVWVQAVWAGRSDRLVRVGRNLTTREQLGEDGPPTLVDDQGGFVLDGLRPGTYRIEAKRTDGSAYGDVDGVMTGESVSVVLEPAGRIVGQVLQEGRPASSFRLDIRGASESTVLVSDPDGRFDSGSLRPGDYKVFISEPGSSTGPGDTAVVVSGQETSVSLSLTRMTTVGGQLLNEDGTPLRGVTVVPRFLQQSHIYRPSSVITGSDGRFLLDAPAGMLLLTVYGHPSHSHRIEVSEDGSDLGQLRPIPREAFLRALGAG